MRRGVRRGLACCVLALAHGGVAAGQDLAAIAIGYFGPDDPAHALGGDPWLAARMAIEEANAAGGHEGVPFELVPVWSEDPWGTGVARLSQTVYRDGLWAIVGAMDGASIHLAETVVAKARLPLLSAVSTDKTVNAANVPWMFSCMPADDALAGVLTTALLERSGERPFTLVSTTDHDSQLVAAEWIKSLSRRGRSPLHHLRVEPGIPRLPETIERVVATAVDSVVILAGSDDSARLLVALRRRAPELRLYGGPSMGRRAFLESAGTAADSVLFPSACDPAAPEGPFGRAFREIHGRPPDCATTQVYDAARLLVAAVQDAGLDRARIRDSLRGLSPWPGQAGPIRWGPPGRNLRPVHLATIRSGRVVPAGQP
jgi:ABC-type branched-subunit amino acid transport system substrate-binding protein